MITDIINDPDKFADKIGVEKLKVYPTSCGSHFFVITRKERNMCIEVLKVTSDKLTTDELMNHIVKEITPLLSMI